MRQKLRFSLKSPDSASTWRLSLPCQLPSSNLNTIESTTTPSHNTILSLDTLKMDLNAPGFHSQGAPAPVNMPRRRRGYDYDYEDRTFIRLPPPTPRTQTYYRLIWYPASTAHSTKAKIKPRSSKLTSILLRQLNAERSMPAQPQPEVILNAGPPQIIVTGPPVPPKPAAPKPAFEGPATFSAPMSHVRADGTVNWTGLPKPSKYVVEYKDGNVVHSIFDPAIRRGTFLDELFDVLMQLLWIPIMVSSTPH